MDIRKMFSERLSEIDEYIAFLQSLESEIATKGPPTLGSQTITTKQQRILYSSVYLHLYNLVEATATWCVDEVTRACVHSGYKPQHLQLEIRGEWIRSKGRTHIVLNPDNRWMATVELCEILFNSSPLEVWQIEKGGGGNWDDFAIEEITKRIGCELEISKPAMRGIKQVIKDDLGALGLVKKLRNKLAHGELSFEEVGQSVVVGDLKDMRDRTVNYLEEVVVSFVRFVDNSYFLLPEHRPYLGADI